MLGFTVPHEFLIQHGSIACASCCSFCLVAWFTQRKGNETKVCITSDVCMSVRTARSGRESSARMPANARASDWISGPQPISIGDADDAAHILLAVTSGGRRARPSSFKPRAGVKGSPAVVELAVHYQIQMKAGARSCQRRAHPLCIPHRQQGNHVRLHLRLPGRARKSALRRR